MSLLVPDYSSSSEDEETQQPAPVAAPAPAPVKPAPAPKVPASSNATSNKKRKLKKPKTTLYLPPEIQRLLESGGAVDDDDSDDDGLLAKQRKAVAAKRARTDGAARSGATSSGLSFLPPPKNEVTEPPAEPPMVSSTTEPVHIGNTGVEASAEHVGPTQPLAPEAAAYYQQYDASAMAQYPQPQQQHADFDYDAYYAQDAESFAGGSSKRARNRDRELERALQQGNFHSVADKIVEVHGPSPHAWQAPEGQRSAQEGDMKVKASFWSTEKGTTVTSIKPSRLQRQRHQLNQLAFDAKAREFELLEKKGSSLKTKAETHAKYGW